MALLQEVMQCIDDLCEVTPVAGLAMRGPVNETFEIALDDATLDAAYLALERDAILLSEDGGLRLHVPLLGLTYTMGLQPLLILARDRGLITKDAYVNVIAGKIARGHDFISIRTEDLVLLAQRSLDGVAPLVAAALTTFRGKSLDVASGVQVAGSMLNELVGVCAPGVVRQYFELALDALQFERPALAADIHGVLSNHLKAGLAKLSRKRQAAMQRGLGSLLKAPTQAVEIKLTQVCAAVRIFLRQQALNQV
jgi:predicted nucleic acid-binding protein